MENQTITNDTLSIQELLDALQDQEFIVTIPIAEKGENADEREEAI